MRTIALKEEVRRNSRTSVDAMVRRFNRNKHVRTYAVGDLVHLKIPTEDRCITDNKRIFCRIINASVTRMYAGSYQLLCQYGILERRYVTRDMDPLESTITHHIPDSPEGQPTVTLALAARRQSDASSLQIRQNIRLLSVVHRSSVGIFRRTKSPTA